MTRILTNALYPLRALGVRAALRYLRGVYACRRV